MLFINFNCIGRMKHIRLSPSTLSLYKECKRCFWLQMNEKVPRPRGIFPSLPGGMDRVLKKYFDLYRGALPPELEGKVEGVLFEDVGLLNKWRNWRIGMSYVDKKYNSTLSGALDDCLSVGDFYAPLDYKTRGSAPKEGASEQYYQHQLDAYALLLQNNGYPVKNFGYLVYYYPKEVHEGGLVQFSVEPVRLETSVERARKLFEDAVQFLRNKEPEARKESTGCEYCVWHAGINALSA